MAKLPARSAGCRVRADDRAPVPARSRRAAPRAAPEFHRWLSPRPQAAARHGILAELRRNVPVPQPDSAIQVLVAAASQRAARRLAEEELAVPVALLAAARPAGREPSADRLQSSPADRPRGRACCERLRGNPGCGDRSPTG